MSTKLITYAETRSVRVERKFIHKWIIQNFDCTKVADNLPSIKFNFTLDYNYSAQLSIIGDECPKRQCEVFINNENTNTRLPWKCIVRLWLGDDKGLFQPRIFSANRNIRAFSMYYENVCMLSKYNSTIICEIALGHYEEDTVTSILLPIQESKLRDDLDEIFKTKKYWDITLHVSDHDLHAHKCILAGRSKVFPAMFEHDMEEAKSNRVSITDIDLEAAEELLRYIYTDEVSNIKEMAFKLLPASDKYDLPKLRSMCENELGQNISIETAAEILILADLHRAQNLMDHAISFIKNNTKGVAATNGWTELTNSYPHLLAKICLQIIN